MSDLISRQAAIDAIESHIRTAEEPYQLTRADEILNHAFEISASCVYNLPSAESEQKWIPADNPPETDDYILLSFENFSVPLVGRYEDYNYYVGDETEPLCKQDIFVNAWMPLPEPYKEGRTDEVD